MYRICFYKSLESKPRYSWPNGADTWDAMSTKLDRFVHAGIAIGGHVEKHIEGIGWVVDDEGNV